MENFIKAQLDEISLSAKRMEIEAQSIQLRVVAILGFSAGKTAGLEYNGFNSNAAIKFTSEPTVGNEISNDFLHQSDNCIIINVASVQSNTHENQRILEYSDGYQSAMNLENSSEKGAEFYSRVDESELNPQQTRLLELFANVPPDKRQIVFELMQALSDQSR